MTDFLSDVELAKIEIISNSFDPEIRDFEITFYNVQGDDLRRQYCRVRKILIDKETAQRLLAIAQ